MKFQVIIGAIVVTAAVGGFFAGRQFTAMSWNRYFEEYAYMRESNHAHQMVRALTYLRCGKHSKAADLLEHYLDSALSTFCFYEDTSLKWIARIMSSVRLASVVIIAVRTPGRTAAR